MPISSSTDSTNCSNYLKYRFHTLYQFLQISIPYFTPISSSTVSQLTPISSSTDSTPYTNFTKYRFHALQQFLQTQIPILQQILQVPIPQFTPISSNADSTLYTIFLKYRFHILHQFLQIPDIYIFRPQAQILKYWFYINITLQWADSECSFREFFKNSIFVFLFLRYHLNQRIYRLRLIIFSRPHTAPWYRQYR